MNDYLIIMDASGDLDVEFAKEYDIKYLPMPYEIDGELFQQTGDDDSNAKSFYDEIRSGKIAKTSQITPFTYKEIFEPYMQQGQSVIYLCLSSALSSTYESACSAAKELNEKYSSAKLSVIDSLAATGKLGIMAERAATNRKAGMSQEDNVKDLDDFKHCAISYGFVDSLMHLKRGGRISTATAVIGTLLNVKPIVRITEDGRVGNFDKCSSERTAIKALKATYDDDGDTEGNYPIYISDADNEKMAQLLETLIKTDYPDAIVRRKALSPIIGTHLGPESVVISFVTK